MKIIVNMENKLQKMQTILEVLQNENYVVFSPDEVITREEIEFMRNNVKNRTIAFKFFTKGEVTRKGKSKKDIVLYNVEAKCSRCGKIEVIQASKTYILNNIIFSNNEEQSYHSYRNPHICDECKAKEKAKEMNREVDNMNRQKQNTDYFITHYLAPSDENTYPKISSLYLDEYNYGQEGINMIVAYNKSLPYKDYLRTPYWKGVSNYKKYKADYKCELCGSSERLEVHHRDYTIRGREADKTNGLICLCHKCHNTFHTHLSC